MHSGIKIGLLGVGSAAVGFPVPGLVGFGMCFIGGMLMAYGFNEWYNDTHGGEE